MTEPIKKIHILHTEKITDEPFDDVIGHTKFARKYFTNANNNIIYKRLKTETDLNELPYLGICVDFGMGDICLEESVNNDTEIFKFYIIDRFNKFEYQEFNNIEDAINKLVEYYAKYEMVSEPEKVRTIFIETLNLSQNKKLSLNKDK